MPGRNQLVTQPPLTIRGPGIAYVCISKNAGTAVKMAWLKALGEPEADKGRRDELWRWCHAHEAKAEGLTLIAPVRNPFIRAVSAWANKVARWSGKASTNLHKIGMTQGLSFVQFCERLPELMGMDTHLARQVDHINTDGSTQADILLKVGNLDRDWEKVRTLWPALPKLQVRNHEKYGCWRDYYGQREIDTIRRLYEADFELGGYSMEF